MKSWDKRYKFKFDQSEPGVTTDIMYVRNILRRRFKDTRSQGLFQRWFNNIPDINILREFQWDYFNQNNNDNSSMQENYSDRVSFVADANNHSFELRDTRPYSKSMIASSPKKRFKKPEKDYKISDSIDESLNTYKLKYNNLDDARNKFYSFHRRSLKISNDLNTNTLRNDSDYFD